MSPSLYDDSSRRGFSSAGMRNQPLIAMKPIILLGSRERKNRDGNKHRERARENLCRNEGRNVPLVVHIMTIPTTRITRITKTK
jgi:hypothetical protein